MNTVIKSVIAVVLFVPVIGCGLGGPTHKEITEAVEASMRGVQSSMKKENMQILQQFTNAAEIAFVNDEQTVSHEMSFMINDNHSVSLNGECSFEEYEDSDTNYTINGSFSYDLVYPNFNNPNNGYGEISIEADLDGGKVYALEMYLNVGKKGQIEEVYVKANGKERNYEKEKGIHNFFKYLDPSVVN